jgi:glycerophosphoryl diester phosphodiesterase
MPPLLLGHRGARLTYPENTFLAFETALEHGCDGFEFDVRKTSDAQALICHDADVQRVPVADNTYLNLAKLTTGPMPRLEDVVRRYAGRAFLDIELKVGGLDDCVTAILKEAPPQQGYCVSAFLPEVLESLHRAEPELKLGYICDDERRLGQWRELPVAYVIPQYSMADAKLVSELHAAGKQVFVWTVNQEKEMRRMAELGVDAIISDDTQLLCRALRKR